MRANMKNVLIPTDLSLRSLEMVGVVAANMPERLNISLFHAFEMPESLSHVMRLRHTGFHSDLVTETLRIRCRQLRAEHANIAGIRFQLICCTTVVAFSRHAEALGIDVIIYPEGYRYVPVTRESVDPHRMFMKCGLPVIRSFAERVAGPVKDRVPAATERNKDLLPVNQ